jgi:lipoprotein NlpI
MMTRTFLRHSLIAAGLATALSGPAAAQQDQPDTPAEAMTRCVAGEGGALLTVQSCSYAMRSGKLLDEGVALALLRRAAAYDELGQEARAAADFERSLELRKTSLGYRVRSDFHASRRRYDAALADLGEAIRLAPRDAELLAQRGTVNDWAGHPELAVADYSEAIRLKPEANFFAGRGDALGNLGRLDDALADFATAIQKKSDLAGAYQGRGRVLFRRDDFAAAAADFRRAIDLDPKQPYYPLWLYLALAHLGGDAKGELQQRAAALDLKEWPGPIVELYLGQIAPDAVVAPDHEREVFRLGWRLEADFYKGELLLLAGDRAAAAAAFRAGIATGVVEFIEYPQAAAELRRLGN